MGYWSLADAVEKFIRDVKVREPAEALIDRYTRGQVLVALINKIGYNGYEAKQAKQLIEELNGKTK